MFYSEITGKSYKSALSRQNAENRFGKKGVSHSRVWTQEDREKHSKLLQEIQARPEVREKISNGNRGKKRTPEQKAALSVACRAHWAANPKPKKEPKPKPEPRPRKPYTKDPSKWTETGGRIISAESAEKIRLLHVGKVVSHNTKKKMSDAKKDVPKSPEHVTAMCVSQQRRWAAVRGEPWAIQWYIDNGKPIPEPRSKKNR